MKKKILLLLSLCTLAVNSQLIQAETVSTPTSTITSSQNSVIHGQLSVVEEDGEMKAVFSDVTGEITGVTAQFSSTQNKGYEISFHLDEHGRYVTILDRSHFSPNDEDFSLAALVQLKDVASQQLLRHDFKWVKATEETFARPEEVESEYIQESEEDLAVSARSIVSNETTAKQESPLSQEVSSNSARSVQAQSSNDTVTSASPATPTGTISVSNIDANSGSFDVRVTNISSPKDIASVLLPTWSQTNDLRWYEVARQSDGSYRLTVNKKDHKYRTGTYTVHLYYKDSSGGLTGAGGTTTQLSVQRSHTVYLDPGHGGRDSGASYGGVYEKNLALSVANKLRDNLLQRGLNVLMTRNDDSDVDFRTERSRMANESNADLFISLHFNATGVWGTSTTGIETYWYQYDPDYQPKINAAKHNDPTRLAESELLAHKVQDNLVKETGAVSRGVKRETFAVLRETAIPAILVEMGFMDNPAELNIIKEEAYHVRLAKGLAQGVLDWYGIVGGSSGVETSNLSSSQKSFVEIVAPTIQEVAKRNSLLPSVVLSQAILESSWGTSYLATQGNNLFGIKADNTWTGETIEILTNEFRNGEARQEKQLFKKYNSLADSIVDYGQFFTSTPWRTNNYQVYRKARDYQQAILALQQSGYATDPKYGDKLRSMIEQYHFNRLDK